MPTQRFEAPSLDEAVQVVRSQVGPAARIVGATRVRRGGVGGFFAREHVEVEVELVTGSEADGPRAKPGGPGKPGKAGAAVGAGAAGSGTARSRHGDGRPTDERGRERGDDKRRAGERSDERRRAGEHSDERRAGGPGGDGDPMTELITEMAENGPSSILDLAEMVNTEQVRYALADDVPPAPRREPAPAPTAPPGPLHAAATATGPAPVARAAAPAGAASPAAPRAPVPDNTNFAVMLERIAREAGLAPPGEPPATPGATDDLLSGASASHSSAILTELRPAPPAGVPRQASATAPARPGELSGLGLAVHALGLPLPACQAVRSVTAREQLETELCRALQLALPPLPSPPQSPNSIIAVVGPRDEVMTAAWAVAADIGAPRDQIAIATQRTVWRSQEQVLGPPEDVAEERRTWRWRDRPSVIAIEQPVRVGASLWASEMLRAIKPGMCWGVAEASHKPEDLAAWSRALGGLDVLALVDLEGTTTPAAALAAGVPVGSLDGQPATAQLWARVLCARLMG